MNLYGFLQVKSPAMMMTMTKPCEKKAERVDGVVAGAK